MAPPLIIRVITDARAAFATNKELIGSYTSVGDAALATAVDFSKAAQAQVAANAKQIAAARALNAELTRIQATTIAGTDERIAADTALAASQIRLNRALGITGAATAVAGAEAKKAERDFGKFARGALAGSGAASELGRSLAFASTGFIAIAGGSTLIAESIRKALELTSTQRKVAAQLATSGKSWDDYSRQIEETDLHLSHISGFTNADLLRSFGYLVRATGSVSQSLRLNAVAADVARGRNISLSSASIALSKAIGGSATALRRLGIIVPKNVKGLEAINFVAQKFRGQAAAGATSADHFRASLANAQEVIGTALLPTFDRLISHFGEWLNRMTESGRLQRDVNAAIKTLGDGFHALEAVIRDVNEATGSFGKTLVLIGEIWAGVKIAKWINSLKLLAVEWGLVGAAATKAAEAEAVATGASAGGVILPRGVQAGAVAGAAAGASRFARLIPRGVGGALALGIGGQIAGQIAGNLIPGQAGQATSGALKFAGLGAGIGTLLEPGGGTAIGAGIGALVGVMTTFVHEAPSFNQATTQMAQNLKSLGDAAKQSGRDLLELKSSLAQARVSRDDATQAVRQARAQEASTRSTTRHAAAVDRLAAAQYSLQVINQQIAATESDLSREQQYHAEIVAQQQAATKAFSDQLVELRRRVEALNPSTQRLAALQAGLDVPLGASVDKLPIFIRQLENLEGSLKKTHDPMAKVVENLTAIAKLFGEIPDQKTIELVLQATLQGAFTLPRVGPGGAIFPTGPRGVGMNPPPTAAAPTTTTAPWTGFKITLGQEIAQARAAMTKSLADDVAVAKDIIARIKRLIDIGKIVPGTKAYLQALQAWGSALAVVQNADEQAAQKRKDAAQKALQIASSYTTPIALQIEQVQAEMTATSRDDIRILKKIIADAQRVLRSGKKNRQGRLAALQTILNAQQTLQGLTGGGDIIPQRLQLELARAQALGRDQTGILLKMRKALYRALRASKGNLQKQTDIWNEIYGINQQLGGDVNTAYGKFKKASLKALTAGRHLGPAERRALEEILSARGPGGTIPASGAGAAGFVIDPVTGRPVDVRRGAAGYGGGGGGARRLAGRSMPAYHETITINLNIDGRHITSVVTKRQQRYRKSNPQSRRGPHAATATA